VHQPERHAEIYLSRTGTLSDAPVEGVSVDYRG
jgi:hypothetical protein